MNRAPITQQNKVENSTLPVGGILQRKCACGSKTLADGECAECGKKNTNLQRKLTIGASNDPLEREADRVAEQVMAAPLNSGVNTSPPRIQRFSGQANDGLAAAPASVDRVLASSGRPLEPALRQDMESRFGYDFSHVRVHTGGLAEQSAREINAQAYSVGNNVVFGVGKYLPSSTAGRRLLAHELVHTLQQARSGKQVQRVPSDTKGSVVINPVSNSPLEMWKNLIAQRHFSEEAPKGYNTYTQIRVLDSEGNTLEDVIARSTSKQHAEEGAVEAIRHKLKDSSGKLKKAPGGKIVVVTDQIVCSKAGRCRLAISNLARDIEVESAEAHTFARPKINRTGPSTPKTTATGVRNPKVEDLSLEQKSEELYRRKTPQSKRVTKPPKGGLSPKTDSTKSTTGNPSSTEKSYKTRRTTPLKHPTNPPKGGLTSVTRPDSFKIRFIGNLVAAVTLEILTHVFHKQFIDVDMPVFKIDQQSAQAYFRDKKNEETLRFFDLLNKNIPEFHSQLKELNNEIVLEVAAYMAKTVFSKTTPGEKRDQIQNLRGELSVYLDDLLVVEENIERSLELEEKAMKSANSAKKLYEYLETGIAIQFLFNSGFSVQEISTAQSNLRSFELKVKKSFRDLKELIKTVSKFIQEANDADSIALEIAFELSFEEGKRLKKLKSEKD